MIETNDQPEKQQYLLEQVIEQGFQPEDFQQFLERIKPGQSGDINMWTLAELKECVHRFKHSVIQAQQTPKPQANEYFKTISTMILEKSIVGQTDSLDIRIVGFEKVPGGFFSSPYTVFRINTLPQQWSVLRKYSDFVQLREVLARSTQGLALPLLPVGKSGKRQSDMLFMNQQDLLQRFISFIISTPEYLNHVHFESFLSLSTEKDWNNLAKNLLKAERVRRLDHLQTVSGEVPVRINQDLNLYFDNAERVVMASNHQLKRFTLNQIDFRVRKLSKQLIVDFDRVQGTLYEIGEVFQRLQQIQFQEKTLIPEFALSLRNMSIEWGNYIQEQKVLLNKSFVQSLKFTYCSTTQLVELIQQRDVAQMEYFEFQSKLQQRKERLFTGDAARWEIDSQTLAQYTIEDLQNNRSLAYHHMLPKETFISRELKNIFGFYNQRVFEQINQTMATAFNTGDFLKFAKEQSFSMAKLHHLWADTITNLQLISSL